MRSIAASLMMMGAAWFAPHAAGAEEAPALSPELAAAVEAWLADDDETALPVLAERAAAGDVTAQMLISQIERETPPGAETPYVLQMNRNTRKSTFRAPGGLSGTPWVRKLGKEGDALAQALYDSKMPDASLDIARTMLEHGEAEQARRLVWEILNRGRFDAVMSLPPDDPLVGAISYLPFLQAWFAQGARAEDQRAWLLEHAQDGAPEGMILVNILAPLLAPQMAPKEDVTRVVLALRGQAAELVEAGRGETAWVGEFLRRVSQEEEGLQPVSRYCASTCPEQPGLCMISAIALLDGVDRMMHQDSPFEGAISQEAYLASPRSEGVLDRRLRAAATRNTVAASGYEVSSCLAAVATGG